jgi:hypothetical protein
MSLIRCFFLFLAFSLQAKLVLACDPCSVFNSALLQGYVPNTFTFSVSEQNTNFDRANDLKENSIKDGELVRDFSTTQLSFAYDATDRFGIQLNLPFIIRRYDQIKQYRSSTETDSGIGDLSLLGRYSFINYKSREWALIANLQAGIKLPTGDTGVLEDVSEEEGGSTIEKSFFRNHSIASTSGGRALTFGTGSTDYIAGLNMFARYQRFLILSSAQYTIRTEGDFNYEFADDFLWSLASGYYIFLEHDFTMAGLMSLSGEHKGLDSIDDQLVEGSKVSNLYLGPGLLLAINKKIGAELNFDFRVTDEDSGAAVVPETRIRASLSYRFS